MRWLTLFTLLRVVVLSPEYSDCFMQGLIPAAEQCKDFPKFIVYSIKRRFLVVSNLRRRHVALLVTPINGHPGSQSVL